MEKTSHSLLERARVNHEDESWQRLVSIYEPVLQRWLNQYSLQPSDVEDLIQDSLAAVSRDLPKFEHNGRVGAFRKWLKTILINRLRNYWRSHQHRPLITGGTDFNQQLQQLEDPNSQLSKRWDREYEQQVLEQIWELIKSRFSKNTQVAFARHVRNGVPASEVASELGMSVNAVLIAKSRILKEMRLEAEGLIDV